VEPKAGAPGARPVTRRRLASRARARRRRIGGTAGAALTAARVAQGSLSGEQEGALRALRAQFSESAAFHTDDDLLRCGARLVG